MNEVIMDTLDEINFFTKVRDDLRVIISQSPNMEDLVKEGIMDHDGNIKPGKKGEIFKINPFTGDNHWV